MRHVFRNYDLAALELQYSGSAREPEIAPARAERERRVIALNEQVRAERPRQLDLVYGVHPRARLDYFPTADRFAPLFVFIHGGYWKSRSKDMFSYLAPAFTDRGVNFAAVGYPLAPEVRLTDIVANVRKALHWLLSYPSGLRFDPTRLHVGGHSAGGHLAAMAMATDWTKWGLPRDTVKSATCVSGLYDLEPLTLCSHLRDLRIDVAEVKALSPTRLAPGWRGRLVITVGSAEGDEFLRNTAELAAAWRKRGVQVVTPKAAGRRHFDVLDELTERGRPLNRAVFAAIGRR